MELALLFGGFLVGSVFGVNVVLAVQQWRAISGVRAQTADAPEKSRARQRAAAVGSLGSLLPLEEYDFPHEVVQFAELESEPWAQESKLERVGEIYNKLQVLHPDASPITLWQTALQQAIEEDN